MAKVPNPLEVELFVKADSLRDLLKMLREVDQKLDNLGKKVEQLERNQDKIDSFQKGLRDVVLPAAVQGVRVELMEKVVPVLEKLEARIKQLEEKAGE